MKLIIAGSRDYNLTTEKLDHYIKFLELEPTLIISGGARGPDTIAIQYAKEKNIPVKIFYPDWSTGRGAGMVRNKLMAQEGDELLAFWDHQSKGTKNMIENMDKLRKRVYIIDFYIQQSPTP